MKRLAAAMIFLALPLFAQQPPGPSPTSLKALAFLEGTWDAKAQGSSGTAAAGDYTFRLELDGHVLARHSRTADCKGPATFDCEHGDLLYIYQDAPGQPLKAIYFDSEGHVIHYDLSTPTPTTAVFLSDPLIALNRSEFFLTNSQPYYCINTDDYPSAARTWLSNLSPD
jgi:hypothetical protein